MSASRREFLAGLSILPLLPMLPKIFSNLRPGQFLAFDRCGDITTVGCEVIQYKGVFKDFEFLEKARDHDLKHRRVLIFDDLPQEKVEHLWSKAHEALSQERPEGSNDPSIHFAFTKKRIDDPFEKIVNT